jgi:hypothetical protein
MVTADRLACFEESGVGDTYESQRRAECWTRARTRARASARASAWARAHPQTTTILCIRVNE